MYRLIAAWILVDNDNTDAIPKDNMQDQAASMQKQSPEKRSTTNAPSPTPSRMGGISMRTTAPECEGQRQTDPPWTARSIPQPRPPFLLLLFPALLLEHLQLFLAQLLGAPLGPQTSTVMAVGRSIDIKESIHLPS